VFGPEASKEDYDNNMYIDQKRTCGQANTYFDDDLIKHDTKTVPLARPDCGQVRT
jgi:hypothetical protein